MTMDKLFMAAINRHRDRGTVPSAQHAAPGALHAVRKKALSPKREKGIVANGA